MRALSQTPDLALLALAGVSLLLLVFGLVWRARRPREAAPAKVRRDALVPLGDAVSRGPGALSDAPPPMPAAPGPVRVRGPVRAATSATAARQAAKSALMAGDVRIAADAYRGAGLIDEAVNLLVGVLGAPEEAATMLVKAGRHERAAELFQTAGLKREAAEQWAEVARRSSAPGKLIESIAALDWDVARELVAELGKRADHPDASGIKSAAALLRTIDAVKRGPHRPIPREDEDDDSLGRLSDEEARVMAEDATRVMTWSELEGRPDDEDEDARKLPPQRGSLPSIVETPFDDDDPIELAALGDEAVALARVGPTVDQLSAYVKGPCNPGNVEVHYRVAVAMIARGAWDRALTLLQGVEGATPGFRDVAAKTSAITAWRKRLGSRREVGDGRYELVGEWRRHRHAVTFRALDRTDKREVLLHRLAVVNTVEAAFDACPSLRTFQTLLHPNVARIHDVFLDDFGRVIVVTELSDASSLRERIARSALPVAECLRVAVEIASACEHLHSRGLGMEELYPGCVSSVPGGVVKLEPLGFGALLDGRGDHARHLAPYLPPEGHQQHDEHATVYELGATLLHAITQKPPTFDETVTVDSLKELKVPGAFATIIARAMARDPADRFPSSNGMRLTLRSLLRQVHGRASQTKIAIPGS